MSSQLIKEKAYNLFAKKGYEGTSMSHIAEEVGIKKASIYSHFKGKKELYFELYHEALENEYTFIKTFFSNEEPLEQQLRSLLHSSIERFYTDQQLHFLLRQGFFPPSSLKSELIETFNQYIDTLEDLLAQLFTVAIDKGIVKGIDAKKASIVFVSLLDSVYVELLYGEKEKAKVRADASWDILWRGMQGGEIFNEQ
ncbi:TetR/AcrR family transcriptional regulator [Bacillus sp. FJAT-47783]|uniref:TetR/AcrR family transcriptional regulator n=1 Tax=Bacillus sp. FJAT-47783 TaxID=2922712 RepID=UPI001FACBAA1|nr:TetR/AcrR family transcriptional regulator [Bacillus sp. FJAT-47783]